MQEIFFDRKVVRQLQSSRTTPTGQWRTQWLDLPAIRRHLPSSAPDDSLADVNAKRRANSVYRL